MQLCFPCFQRAGLILLGWITCGVPTSQPMLQGAELSPKDRAIARAIDSHIAFLADDLLEGRGTGTSGYDVAARYVASHFGALGLIPAGDSNTWYQSVPLREGTLENERSVISLKAGEGFQPLTSALDFVLLPNMTEEKVEVSGSLVFVGYGVYAPELQHDDFRGVDLKGRIAVVLGSAPPRFAPTALAHHSSRMQKQEQLAVRGAVGMISIPTPKDLEESPWPKRVAQARFPSMRWTRADGSPAQVFPTLKAVASISPAGAGKVFAKAPISLQQALTAAARGEIQNFPLNQDGVLAVKTRHRQLTSPNVLGLLRGSDPKLRNETLVLTAHLDHLGRGAAVKGDRIYNGAYDNAIGCAMIMECMRLLAGEGRSPRRSVLAAAVTAEEKGLVGSEFLAGHPPAMAGRFVGNVNLDMVLATRPSRHVTMLGIEHSSLRDPVETAASRFGFELLPDPRPDRVAFVRSDQYSFVRNGIPAVSPKITDLPGTRSEPGVFTPDEFVKVHYHQPSDESTLPRDEATSVRFVRFMAEVIRLAANSERPPRWNPGDFFGETFGKTGEVQESR
ncbi:MAG: M28 family peptidase [Verrucomicrobia bacterium]|nr:M28 family peptidase [Verrucomicrobiota bacterium]